ncbi:YtxH domain-containing protein, partial [Listeria monocytogenes]|nr:YtxH domain-containing protein [Listeria monocytogenes]EAH2179083.1 YtxH domain-containing protein [Listeria monocytogenes]
EAKKAVDEGKDEAKKIASDVKKEVK